MKENKVLCILVGLGAAMIIFLLCYETPEEKTNGAIDRALAQMKKLDSPPPYLELPDKDGWGHPLIFRFQHDTHALTYTVTSKGKDGIEGTPDDISKSAVDHNVARIIGEWTAEKAKQFFKGVKDGAEKESKYDKP